MYKYSNNYEHIPIDKYVDSICPLTDKKVQQPLGGNADKIFVSDISNSKARYICFEYNYENSFNYNFVSLAA